MASVDESLESRLQGFAGLNALISGRVYPSKLPQGVTYPAISFTRISTTESHAMGVDTGVKRARFQVSCWGSNKATAYAVAEQVDLALRRWKGLVGSVQIDDTLLEDRSDGWDEAGLVYHIPIDAVVIYQG
jgi:hypothetical protein